METTTKSASQTQKLGQKVATDVIGSKKLEVGRSGATVLALSGDLGSGKTTFLQGFAKGLGIKQRIISPTFILFRQYKIRFKIHDSRFKSFYHIDLYRLEENVERELINLGFQEIVSDPVNIVAIEWADKGERVIPKRALWVKFTYISDYKRKINID